MMTSSPGNSPLTLKDAALHCVVTITEVQHPNPQIRNRLFAFGLIKGRQLKVTRIAPHGGTRCVELMGYHLALRLSEADCVSILI